MQRIKKQKLIDSDFDRDQFLLKSIERYLTTTKELKSPRLSLEIENSLERARTIDPPSIGKQGTRNRWRKQREIRGRSWLNCALSELWYLRLTPSHSSKHSWRECRVSFDCETLSRSSRCYQQWRKQFGRNSARFDDGAVIAPSLNRDSSIIDGKTA